MLSPLIARLKLFILETVPSVFWISVGVISGVCTLMTVPAGIIVVLVKTIVHSHVLRVSSSCHALSEK